MQENKIDTSIDETEQTKDEVSTEQVDTNEETISEENTNVEVTKESEIDILKKQADDMKDLAQRTQAEFMNYKKRVAKEKQDLTTFANEKIVTELLGVLDNFDRALSSEKDSQTPFYQGVDMIRKQLFDTLQKNGLEQIDAIGQEFDPNYHHAVMQEDGGEPNKVLEVLQVGYKLKERVIRPAMVKVSK